MSRYVELEQLLELRRQVGQLLDACVRSAVDVPERPLEPHDGKPRVRPHSIPGHWQVWSGGICIALLGPEDVAPIVVAASSALADAAKPKRSR